MAASRSHWWFSRDVHRPTSRCEFTAGKAIDTAERRHLRMSAEILSHGALPLSDDDRARVERVYQDVRGALGERAS